jgi:hypothetical protein
MNSILKTERGAVASEIDHLLDLGAGRNGDRVAWTGRTVDASVCDPSSDQEAANQQRAR